MWDPLPSTAPHPLHPATNCGLVREALIQRRAPLRRIRPSLLCNTPLLQLALTHDLAMVCEAPARPVDRNVARATLGGELLHR